MAGRYIPWGVDVIGCLGNEQVAQHCRVLDIDAFGMVIEMDHWEEVIGIFFVLPPQHAQLVGSYHILCTCLSHIIMCVHP